VEHLNAADIKSLSLPSSSSLAAKEGDENASMLVTIVATIEARLM
jgi:hypothetical protein